MPVITNIRDLRALARRRVPRAIFDYADSGSYDEITIRQNRIDLDAIRFRQRILVDISRQSVATRIVGQDWAAPFAIAPTGLAGLFHRNGEICGARAAERFGVPFCLSTMSICSIEEVREAVQKPFWFQLYVMRDRGFSRSLIERATAAQCPALVLTVDLQVQGQRHREIKNGLTIPPRLTFRNAVGTVIRPAWALGVLFGKRRSFGNLAGRIPAGDGMTTLAAWIATQFDPSLGWKDVEWIRSLWPGKLILKGILDGEDARLAAAAGADAIVVSNHGGRQLDSARSSISALPGIVDAVGDQVEILFDGGIQSGQDVLKALALGARGCLIGKSFLFALAALGEAGVEMALGILSRELAVSMGLTGISTLDQINSSILVR